MQLDDKMSFLGDFWVIGDMNPAGGNEASEPEDGFIRKLYSRGVKSQEPGNENLHLEINRKTIKSKWMQFKPFLKLNHMSLKI